MTIAKYELWPVADLSNIIASLAMTGQGFGGDFGRGWVAALAALGVAVGVPVSVPLSVSVLAPAPQLPAPASAPCGCGHSHAGTVIVDVMPAPSLRQDDYKPTQLGPSKAKHFDGIEDVPWAIGAFARLE